MLYIVATPIGNLKDITLRAIETLKNVDEIICEDTRRSSLLLHEYGINKPLTVLNDFNEAKQIEKILDKLKSGINMALISDAGTPLISDPGYKLIRSCIENNTPLDSTPGAVSPVVALTLSGLSPDKFLFLGYPPEKPGKRKNLFEKIKKISEVLEITFILFLSPYKIITTLNEMFTQFGDINITLAKELTKIHQSVQQKSISSWLGELEKSQPKGEYILLFRLGE